MLSNSWQESLRDGLSRLCRAEVLQAVRSMAVSLSSLAVMNNQRADHRAGTNWVEKD